MEDTKEFWKRHKKAKAALHKRLLASLGEKELQRRIAESTQALKNARIVQR